MLHHFNFILVNEEKENAFTAAKFYDYMSKYSHPNPQIEKKRFNEYCTGRYTYLQPLQVRKIVYFQ